MSVKSTVVRTLSISTAGRDNPLLPSELVVYLADHIEGARLVELSGTDLGVISTDVFQEIAEFLTGAAPVQDKGR